MNRHTVEATTVLNCPECGARMRLIESRRFKRLFWSCSRWPDCDGAHGAHPDGRPLGEPADKATRKRRHEVHEAFDWLWQEGHMPRSGAYKMLAGRLGLDDPDCHIGRFDIETCDKALAALKTFMMLKGTKAGLERKKRSPRPPGPQPRARGRARTRPPGRPPASGPRGPLEVIVKKTRP